jgi:uncharacterized RDD family membrane protein YckC
MQTTAEDHCKPSLIRYLGVMVYDTLLLLSVLLLAASLAVMFNAFVNHGEAIEPGNPFFFTYLIAVSFFFYGWFWTHGGQTLGMRSWKIYLINKNQTPISWQQALFRFMAAIISWIPLGLGFWWLYFSKQNQSWPDALSNTQLHFSKKAKNKPLSRLS